MKRIVQPELLDALPPDDPRAQSSRRDLRRVNAWMRHPAIMRTALQTLLSDQRPKQVTELGAGDGHFLLRVAQDLTPRWSNVTATLLDLQENTPPQTLAEFTSLDWRAETVVADVFDWLPQAPPGEVVIANLFLHHFEDARLRELLGLIAGHAKVCIALEPRRARWPLFCSRLLWAIGCNEVTRHDAVVSVRAGFSGNEISHLWPDQNNWRLTEKPAGMFGHLFIAERTA